uniref:Chromosome 9 open reading frame 16 n=1 Tax=Dromaius novaehollandiae TaxID=8790 RepID=A0A8C4P6N4_DRONO
MSGPNGEPHVAAGAAGRDDDDDGDSFGEEEYAAINSMLDQINSCLDHLEEKNDYLHACLKELLESNRQTRLEFQQQHSPGLAAEPFKQRRVNSCEEK